MGPFSFDIKREVTTGTNSIGEPIVNWETVHEVEGYLDLLTGDEANSSNSFIEESSHVFMLFDVTVDITNADRIYNPRSGLTYEITFVDNPMELNSQYEIYCKKVA